MITLGQEFSAKKLILYAMPTILMMVFMSTYTIVDGLFVANLVGEDALSAVNIITPIYNVLFAIGLMFATGGTAVMGKLMGEKKYSEARSFLSTLYLIAITLGISLTILLLIFAEPILSLLGAQGALYEYASDYLFVLSFFAITFFLQTYVQSFFVLAGKPSLGLLVCLLGGLTNIGLDYIFISPNYMDMGIAGAALATGLGNTIPAVFGIIYFSVCNKGYLYFEKPKFEIKTIQGSMFNGMSELSSQLSTAVTTLLFNIILLNLVGNAGVATISVILYIQMIQTAIYFGYSMGVAPIISYKFGAQDHAQLKHVIKISGRFIMAVSFVIIFISLAFSDIAVGIFISKSSSTFAMAKEGLMIFSIAYLFMGINIFMSSMFTSLSNGKVSAFLSLTRTLVFLVASLLILPELFGLIGVWFAVPVAEFLGVTISYYCYKKNKEKYGY